MKFVKLLAILVCTLYLLIASVTSDSRRAERTRPVGEPGPIQNLPTPATSLEITGIETDRNKLTPRNSP